MQKAGQERAGQDLCHTLSLCFRCVISRNERKAKVCHFALCDIPQRKKSESESKAKDGGQFWKAEEGQNTP
jgi:hypothetical protein